MTTAETTPSPVEPDAGIVGRPVLMTREGEAALRREIDRLRAEAEVELPERLRVAREFGEPAGNDDILQISEEQAVTMARIENLRRALSIAKIVDESDFAEGVAAVGTRVTMRVDGKELTRRLVGSHEPVNGDGMSIGSPIGGAIMGRLPGETVVVDLPSGKRRQIEIVAVEPDEPPAG